MESRLPGHARFHGSFLENNSTNTQVELETMTDLLKLKKLIICAKLTGVSPVSFGQ